ncbi:hypothetical protein XENORESO_011741 [Xenotaenia resolanae]|uniref:Ig-like domain-containing protein n=1 Tax=Xenotaenia resolanae TaxID=208358 RepID=A0ABV0X014_9TELE
MVFGGLNKAFWSLCSHPGCDVTRTSSWESNFLLRDLMVSSVIPCLFMEPQTFKTLKINLQEVQIQSEMNVCVPVEPYVRIHSEAPSSGGHPGMLVCGVYSFYPKTIKVSWLRNGLEITSGVTSTEELPDGDWYYQVHSQLEYTPRSGEKISCRVEHASLKEPLITDWSKYLPHFFSLFTKMNN